MIHLAKLSLNSSFQSYQASFQMASLLQLDMPMFEDFSHGEMCFLHLKKNAEIHIVRSKRIFLDYFINSHKIYWKLLQASSTNTADPRFISQSKHDT